MIYRLWKEELIEHTLQDPVKGLELSDEDGALECLLALGKLVLEEDIDGLIKALLLLLEPLLGGFKPLHAGLALHLKALLAVLVPLLSLLEPSVISFFISFHSCLKVLKAPHNICVTPSVQHISQKVYHWRLEIYVRTYRDVVGHRQKTTRDSETHGLNVREVYVSGYLNVGRKGLKEGKKGEIVFKLV